jgi:hypothetical protein
LYRLRRCDFSPTMDVTVDSADERDLSYHMVIELLACV